MIRSRAVTNRKIFLKEDLIPFTRAHRLRPIDTHLAMYTMLYNNSAKNRYAEPVRNKNNANIENQGLMCPPFSDKRKRYENKRTLYTFINASN